MDDEQVPPERMRASDADRDAVAERLATALQEGRLDLNEYQQRLDQVMRAKTMGELAPITRDIPLPPPRAETAEDQPPMRTDWRQRLEPWRGLAAISVILVGIWGVTSVVAGTLLPFWPVVPIGFMFMFTLASAIGGPYIDGSCQDHHGGHGCGGCAGDDR